MIRDEQLAALLRAGTDDIDVSITPATSLAAAGQRRLRRRRIVGAVGVAAAVACGCHGGFVGHRFQPGRDRPGNGSFDDRRVARRLRSERSESSLAHVGADRVQ